MNINIIKAAGGFTEKKLEDGRVLQIVESDSQYENVKSQKFYLYNLEKHSHTEIMPDIKKYNLIEINDIKYKSNDIYFTELTDGKDSSFVNAVIYRYNYIDNECEEVYSFEAELSKYNNYKRTRVFAVNEYYILIQNETLRSNLMENYEGYFDFDISMYSIAEKKSYKLNDDKINQCGINTIIPVSANVCILKIGFNLFIDERYKKLTKEETVLESVSFVNIGQMVSDILIGQKNIVMDTIEQVFFNKTIPYVKVKGNYICYSVVKLEDKLEEEVVFYDYVKKTSLMCINSNKDQSIKLVDTDVIGGKPYIIKETAKGCDFIDITDPKNIITLEKQYKLVKIEENIIIATLVLKTLFGKSKEYVVALRFPSMQMLHREKGTYDSSVISEKGVLNIMIK